ncbi:MAG: DUF2723 domain-containing protein [Candidatus Eremiobacteraeota bacterium]|nr:DUF2723 domain-containing protein [Candidatus Eremiobacteraeota bacterium]
MSMKEGHRLPRGINWLYGGLLWAFSLVVYGMALSPSLSSQSDSGELVTAAVTAGIAHPPGYPLYTMTGHLFSKLPFLDGAFRVNLMSAFFSSMAVLVLFFLCLRLFANPLVSASTALLFAFSRAFFRISLSAEVFSLHLLFVVLLLYLMLCWKDASGRHAVTWEPYLFFFTAGLSLSHHHTVLLLAPLLLYFIISGRLFTWLMAPRNIAAALVLFAAGLLPYLYLPLRAASDPPVNWGNPRDWEAFVRVVTRAGYGSLSLATVSGSSWSFGIFLKEAGHYLSLLAVQCTPMALPFMALGAVSCWKRERTLFWGGLFLFLVFSLAFIVWARLPAEEGYLAVLERFFLPSYLVAALAAGEGLMAISALRNCRTVALGAALVLPCAALLMNFGMVTRRSDYLAIDYGRNVLRSVGNGGILFVSGDVPSSALLYCQSVEGLRGDVTVLVEGLLDSPWYRRQLARRHKGILPEGIPADTRGRAFILKVIEGRQGKGPVYFNHPVSDSAFPVVSQGLVSLVLKPGEGPSREQCEAAERLLGHEYQYRGCYDEKKFHDYFSRELLRLYGLAWYSLGLEWAQLDQVRRAYRCFSEACRFEGRNAAVLLKKGQAEIELALYGEAEKTLGECLASGGSSREVFMNLAVLYARQGQVEKAREALRRARGDP